MIEEKLLWAVRQNPIRDCVELSKRMVGTREGYFYYTEGFRINFEKRMSRLAQLEEENKRLKEHESIC